MVSKDNKLKLAIVILIFLFIFSTSCSLRSNHNDLSVDELRDVYVYTSKAIDLYSENEYLSVNNVIPYNDYYYAIVQCIPVDLSEAKTFLYCIDSNGNKNSEIELNPDINIYVSSDILNDELLYVTYTGKLERVDINTGEIVYSTQFNQNLCGVTSYDDGYVLLSIGRIEKYDCDDNLVASIENQDWCYFNGFRTFYENSGICYLLSDIGFQWKYYELNFENATSKLIYDPTIEENRLLNCSGKFVFDESGEYLVDFENSCKYPLAKWDDMNLQPPQYTNVDPVYIGVDNEEFLQIYNYESGISQIVIYKYEEAINYSDRTYITIGGFNCSDDLALNWAIFKYNTSQNEYRVIIEDYSRDFGWDSLAEAASQKAALIQYFNDGNTPDIFYGNSFDYDLFATNGTTLDISQYMTDDFLFRFESVTPNIRELMMNDDGSCYRIFSCYQLEGYSSFFDVNENLSISEITELSVANGTTIISNETAFNLATYAIQNSIFNEEIPSEDDIRVILNYSYVNGISSNSVFPPEEMSNTTIDEYVLWYTNIFSVLQMNDIVNSCGDDMVFVGYPSVNGSKHVIVPFGQVAISSSTLYPEECCRVISHLLDEDVQDLSNLSCFIPVNDDCMRKMVMYSEDHSLISEEDFSYRMYLSNFHEISTSTSLNFYQYINTVDTVSYYDWGVVNIIFEEVETYYSQDKPIDLIVESLYSRLNVYMSE